MVLVFHSNAAGGNKKVVHCIVLVLVLCSSIELMSSIFRILF